MMPPNVYCVSPVFALHWPLGQSLSVRSPSDETIAVEGYGFRRSATCSGPQLSRNAAKRSQVCRDKARRQDLFRMVDAASDTKRQRWLDRIRDYGRRPFEPGAVRKIVPAMSEDGPAHDVQGNGLSERAPRPPGSSGRAPGCRGWDR